MLDQPAAAHPALSIPAPQASRRSHRRGTQCKARRQHAPGGCLDGGGRPGASTMRRAGAQQHPSRGQIAAAYGGHLHEVSRPKAGLHQKAGKWTSLRATCCCWAQGARLRAPTRSDPRASRAGSCCRPCAAATVSGAATSDAFDSPQPREDYRDVFEKRAPLHSSPPPSAPDWPDETRPLGRWIVVGSPSSPTQMPTAEALENHGGPRRR